jgi:hypothetical protein
MACSCVTPLKPKSNVRYAIVELCCNAIEQVVGADRHEVIGLSLSVVCAGPTLPLCVQNQSWKE